MVQVKAVPWRQTASWHILNRSDMERPKSGSVRLRSFTWTSPAMLVKVSFYVWCQKQTLRILQDGLATEIFEEIYKGGLVWHHTLQHITVSNSQVNSYNIQCTFSLTTQSDTTSAAISNQPGVDQPSNKTWMFILSHAREAGSPSNRQTSEPRRDTVR